ncbi:2-octaprenyl-6-methoxyphenyl hydroxylase [Pseudidiomarina aestuarii]|nr:2-octaprenyl-6-methoxyphenyl hydroxylase [Pseudidiomarina aestuarii]PTB99005.1 2-octaprenyl-6-methoxyphenyl hydroxylase [Marinobacter sp. Z-F4-2]
MDAKQVTAASSNALVVAGGGLVGALTALLVARAQPDHEIVVVEPQPDGPAPDPRTIALAAGTVRVLEGLGVWTSLATQACPIQHIHVSDRHHLGATRLHAEQEGVAALGQVIAASELNQALYNACQSQQNIQWMGDHRVVATAATRAERTVTLESGAGDTVSMTCQLLVGADGNKSAVRAALDIPVVSTHYDQQGIIAVLQLADGLNGWAYERFTPYGPVALLPMPNRQASLVWSMPPDEAEATMNLPAAEFVRAAQHAFGFRAGRFTDVTMRTQYPLQLHLAERSVAHRAVLIGNASHSLHPIAGQGFNLGVRDALSLAAVLSKSTSDKTDFGSYNVLSDYWQSRTQDYDRTIGLTDLLVRGFSSSAFPLTYGRTLALGILDWMPPLRAAFARQTMGLNNPVVGRGEH